MTRRQGITLAGLQVALALAQGCADLPAAPGEDSFDRHDSSLSEAPDRRAAQDDAEAAPAIFAYHTWDTDLLVVMPVAGCYEARAEKGACSTCATKVTVERVGNCSVPSYVLLTRIDAPNGLIVTNQVKNTGVPDRAICEAELGFQRRFGSSERGYELMRSRDYAPWYREHAEDRLSTTDFAQCAEAAPRLRATFYPF